VIEGECKFQPFLCYFTSSKDSAGIVNEDIDARLRRGDFRPNAPGFGHKRQVGVKNAMSQARVQSAKSRLGRFAASSIARNEYDARAQSSELLRCDGAYT
jgi:hypothetical protein